MNEQDLSCARRVQEAFAALACISHSKTAAIDDVGEVLQSKARLRNNNQCHCATLHLRHLRCRLRTASPSLSPCPQIATRRENTSRQKNSMCSSERPAVQISNRTVVMTWQTPVCSIAIAPPYNLDVSCLFRPPLTATSVHSPNKTTTAHQRLARPSRSPKRVFSRLVSN